jgi:thiol:disulfide interchange protein
MNTATTARRCDALAVALLLCLAGAIGLSAPAAAKPWWMRDSGANETDFLPPDVAFRVTSSVTGDQVEVHWIIAEGYYLYRDKIEVLAESPDLVVSRPELPAGTPVSDEFFGVQQIYTQEVTASARYTRSDFGAHPLSVKVRYQGCAKAGLCYPVITKVLYPTAPPETGTADGAIAAAGALRWESAAILGGCLAFLIAGLTLRKARRLPTPAA